MQRTLREAREGDYLFFFEGRSQEWYSGIVKERLESGVEVRSTDRRLSDPGKLNWGTPACIVPPELVQGELTIYGIARELGESGLPPASLAQLLERRTILIDNYMPR